LAKYRLNLGIKKDGILVTEIPYIMAAVPADRGGYAPLFLVNYSQSFI